MSLPYFLTDDPASGRLTGPEGRHAVTVMRIGVGERIVLADGAGITAEVDVTDITGKDTLAGTVIEVTEHAPPRPRVTIVQAIPKSERAELAVDLATQGGADAIIPWISHRTIARWQGAKVDKNLEKWRAAAREAAKQSRRPFVPEVHDPVTTNQLAERLATHSPIRTAAHTATGSTVALVLHEDAADSIAAVDLIDDNIEEIVLIIGPEGGIGEDERELLGARPVRLGPEVLRTASAALAGLSAIGALTARW